MIWDRYDDAMDDLQDDEVDLKAQNQALENKLKQLGVKYDPHIQNEDDSVHDHNDVYWKKSMEIVSLEARKEYLKQILADAEGKNGV